MNDPYNKLIETMRNEGAHYNETPFFIGKITTELPDLKVYVNDLYLDKDNLQIDKFLLDRHNLSVSCSNGSITHNLNDKLSIGDDVIMFRNGEVYIIVSKVVNL